MLKSEHTSEHTAEYRRRNSARHKDLTDFHFPEFPHKRTDNWYTNALTEVSKHYAEYNDISDSDKEWRINFVIFRNTVHLCVKFKRFCKETVFEFDRRRFCNLRLAVWKIYIDAGNFFESASERLSILCRNPTYNDKAFAVLQCFCADFSIKIKLFKLRKVFTDSNLIFVNIIVNPLLSFFKLFLKMGNKALKFF